MARLRHGSHPVESDDLLRFLERFIERKATALRHTPFPRERPRAVFTAADVEAAERRHAAEVDPAAWREPAAQWHERWAKHFHVRAATNPGGPTRYLEDAARWHRESANDLRGGMDAPPMGQPASPALYQS